MAITLRCLPASLFAGSPSSFFFFFLIVFSLSALRVRGCEIQFSGHLLSRILVHTHPSVHLLTDSQTTGFPPQVTACGIETFE